MYRSPVVFHERALEIPIIIIIIKQLLFKALRAD